MSKDTELNNDSEYVENITNDIIEQKKYNSYYSTKGFWTKITKHYKHAGIKIIELALSLYYSLRDSDTPNWAKSIIIGALGYFILPLDILPDFVPIVGFTDDIATITLALATVAIYIKDDHRVKAKQIVIKLFNK